MQKNAFDTTVRTAAFINRAAFPRVNKICYRGSELLKEFLHMCTMVLPG